ncbi:hypothetical protein ACRARG_05050 [Pseudooceanicola sp. C21-150M6]|uniref:hypothetical protein n=1 Tax=Pseudooceanicola sp. C21-150M6 TaxID=3434355 RepID=UPI003D7F613C
MQTRYLAPDREALAMAVFFNRIKKSISRFIQRSPGDRLLEDLERMALLSPHLLNDIGFSRDAAAVPDTTVWRKGELKVVVERSKRTVFASTDFCPRAITATPEFRHDV